MAEFEVCELEGMRWVQIRLRDETVRAEAGALSHMQGDIEVTAPCVVENTASRPSSVKPSAYEAAAPPLGVGGGDSSMGTGHSKTTEDGRARSSSPTQPTSVTRTQPAASHRMRFM